MEVLEVIQKYLNVLGIHPLQTPEQNRFNIRNLVTIFLLVQALLSALAHSYFDARSVREYTECVYIAATALCNNFMFGVILAKEVHFFTFVNNVEETIGDRELKFCS